MKTFLFLMALFASGLLSLVRAEDANSTRILSVAEKSLVGRWQGNEQRHKNGWRQMDFYVFAADGSYGVLILILDPEEKQWKGPSKIDPNESDGFEGEFRVFEDRTLVLNNWFASRQLEFQVKGDELHLKRPMVKASWVMTRTKRFEWESAEVTANIDAMISLDRKPEPAPVSDSTHPGASAVAKPMADKSHHPFG